MCILCVIQKWSRRIATMLPWLVIPLIGLWALSQLLPPAFRFEITSPRLACLLVLLVTLFWYEVLMPQLSAWRIRRNARLREKKRFEAIEMQKLRRTAIRRCRNCFTPYRDQNPGGGKFMCSYCGHISKRPVLDLPVPPGMRNSGILKDLVGKGGKLLNGKAWADNGWLCGQDWVENGNWSGGPFTGKSGYWKKNGNGLFGVDDDHCLAEKSYSRAFVFACKALAVVFFSVTWLWRKIFGVSSSRDDASADAEHRGMLDSRGENGGNGQGSRVEKARRKAEEKRQARLERELLEEEERKQREEVARLVEERRKLRDEKMEAEKEHEKGCSQAKERETKKESERKRREKKKEKDWGSSKSNSDAEELEKRSGKETEKNRKSENDSLEHRNTHESVKSPEVGYGFKGATGSNHIRMNAGSRYLDRMRGTLLSSSRAFTGGGLFGKNINASAVSREHKPSIVAESVQTSIYKKDSSQVDRVSGRSTTSGDDKSANRPVLIDAPKCTAPKKSWQQLFTRSSTVSPPASSNAVSRPTGMCKAEVQSPQLSVSQTLTQSFDNPLSFGLSSPFSLPSFSFGSSCSSTVVTLPSEPMLSSIRDSPHELLPEESEIYEDPCYVPDPVALLGPVSESLDNFQLDLGFITDTGLKNPSALRTKVTPSETTKPSPIESPLSRSRVSEEKHAGSLPFPRTPKAQDNTIGFSDTGTWQMWNSSPLGQDGIGLLGGSVSWLNPEMNFPIKENNIHPVPQKTMASLFKKDELTISGAHSPQSALFGNYQNGGTSNASVPATTGDPWLSKPLLGPISSPESQIPQKPLEESAQHDMIFGTLSGSDTNHQFELPAATSWAKKDWSAPASRDGIANSPINRPHIGGLYSPPDVQSLWSYE